MGKKAVIAVKLLNEEQKARILKAGDELNWSVKICDSEEEALAEAADAEVVFSSYLSLTGAARCVKWYCIPYAGVDEYTAPGVFASPEAVLTNASGAYGVTISEHVIMVTLTVLRRQMEYFRYISEKKWIRKLPVRSIHQSRVTLLGTGDIGKETAKRIRGFGPEKIIGVNRSGAGCEELFDETIPADRLEEILPSSEILILSLPNTKETRHILDEKRLALLPDGAVIVNVGRGSCIDEKALEKELRSGRLFAALDVFEQEPLPEESSLWNCPNLLITPHVAGDLTLAYTREKAIEFFLDNLYRYSTGKPLLHQVDRKKGY